MSEEVQSVGRVEDGLCEACRNEDRAEQIGGQHADCRWYGDDDPLDLDFWDDTWSRSGEVVPRESVWAKLVLADAMTAAEAIAFLTERGFRGGRITIDDVYMLVMRTANLRRAVERWPDLDLPTERYPFHWSDGEAGR